MGDLLTRLSPGTSRLRAVLGTVLPVLGLLIAMLMGTASLVHRRDGVLKQTGEMLELAKCS